jgi:hypothetical protein
VLSSGRKIDPSVRSAGIDLSVRYAGIGFEAGIRVGLTVGPGIVSRVNPVVAAWGQDIPGKGT